MNKAIQEDPIHGWFGLSYASYLVIPRTILQSMPQEWQQRLVDLLEEAEEKFDTTDIDYHVSARKNGKFITDPYRDYQRGRRKLPIK